MSNSIFNGSAAVDAMSYRAYPITVDPALMTHPRLEGRLQAQGGTGNDITVLVLSDAELINWKNNHSARTYYNSGQVTVAELSVQLPASGTFYLVLANDFSAFTPKTVAGHVECKWVQMPTEAEIAAYQSELERKAKEAQDEERLGIIVVVVAVLLVGIGVGGLVAWIAAARKSKGDKAASRVA